VREDREVTSPVDGTGARSPSADAAGQVAPPAQDDVATRLYVVVGRLVRMLRRTGTADVSPGALSALSSLVSAGPCRLGDLASREGVAAPTMTRIVAVLEEGRLVRRTADPQDGRAVVVAATEGGTALVQGESFARSSALRRRVVALSPADRAALDAALPVLEALARDEDA
jgi:DNA-binding MarR family transcriptional regulator